MNRCIWYVSKYVSPPAKASAGGRGFMIMRELAKMGHQCVIITSDSNQLAEVPRLESCHLVQEVEGMELCWVRTMKYQVAKSAKRILSWLDFEWRLWRLSKQQFQAPDVVIVSSLSLLTVLNGFLLRARYRCRLIFEIRDIWPLTITEEGGYSPRNPLVAGLGFIEKLGYRYADEVVGTMPNLQEHVAQVLGYARPVHCIPMGIEDTALTDSEALPADYEDKHIPKGKFIVAHAGTIGITNALDTFFECAVSMRDNQNVHFLIVGDGDLRAHYKSLYAHLPNLSFAPRVPKRMVQSVLAKCDLLYFSVHVSKVWKFGQSLNKVTDYMLAGKPVVASYTGYPSMINEAGCGTYIAAGDVQALNKEILRYAAMPLAEREAIGKKGREWLLTHRRYETLARSYLSIMFPDLARQEAAG